MATPGLAMLVTGYDRSLIMVVAAVVLAVLAKVLDRLKMRELYGRSLGDCLHDKAETDASGNDLARRDVEAFRERQEGLRWHPADAA